MEGGFKPGRRIEGRRKGGVKGPETIGPEGEVTIEYRGVRISAPLKALIQGRLVLETPEGKITAKIERSEEFLKIVNEYQGESEKHRKTAEEAVEALKEKLEIPPEILEKVKEIFRDVKSHLPEIPKILRELEEKLKELEEELEQLKSEKQKINLERQINLEIRIKRLKITIEYLRRLQEITQQIEEGTVPSNIRERLRKDEGFGQTIKKIAELFNALKGEEDIYKGLGLIFPDEKERKEFLDNVRQGQISLTDAINLIAGTILRTLEREGIRVDKYPLERWVKPLLVGIALDIIDRIKQKLEQEQKPPTPEAKKSTVEESFQGAYEAAQTHTPEGLRSRTILKILNEIYPTLLNLEVKKNEVLPRLKAIIEKRKTETLHVEDASGLYELGLIESMIKETKNSIETISQSIDKLFDRITDISREREDQIKSLEESLKEEKLSQESFKEKLRELEDKLNESLNKIKGESGEIEEVLRNRLMALEVLEKNLGISEPEKKEEKERRIMAITKRIPGYILKGLKEGGELLFTGALFLFGELLILMPVLLEKLIKEMKKKL